MNNQNDLFSITNQIIDLGTNAINKFLGDNILPIDYVAIFSQSDDEYRKLTKEIESVGKRVEETSTGFTYKLFKPLDTFAGKLWLIKIRKYDITKLQRGAPDFRVNDYSNYKEKHINNEHINIIIRPDYEMLELVGEDVLVYFPNKPLSKELGINN